jgi:hypothetical protein
MAVCAIDAWEVRATKFLRQCSIDATRIPSDYLTREKQSVDATVQQSPESVPMLRAGMKISPEARSIAVAC